MIGGTPAADVRIDAGLVRSLLEAQHPDLAGLPLGPTVEGWDNVMVRLGDDLAIRMPRRAEAVALAEKEHRWLPAVARRLPLPVPAPVRTGRPASGYPWPWSVVHWLRGGPADLSSVGADQAPVLAAFLRALHVGAPPDAPSNPHRGVPLIERADDVEGRLDAVAGTGLVTRAVRDAWEAALAASRAAASCWIHGDLHPLNVLVRDGSLVGVIDWGDLAGGDPATDVAAVWMLFDDSNTRAACLEAYGSDPALRARAAGWAVFFGATLLATGLVDHPRHRAAGAATLRRLDEDGHRHP